MGASFELAFTNFLADHPEVTDTKEQMGLRAAFAAGWRAQELQVGAF